MRYSVGTVARVLGLTPGALHYYEREGLLSGERSGSGHRYYDDADLWRLLSYEKYHSMEYPIKTVIDQFTGGGSRALIEERVRDRLDDALRKSEHYRQLALSIQEHVDAQARIDELLDRYAFERFRPTLFWHADEGWISHDRAQQDIAARWVAAMPASQIAVRMQVDAAALERLNVEEVLSRPDEASAIEASKARSNAASQSIAHGDRVYGRRARAPAKLSAEQAPLPGSVQPLGKAVFGYAIRMERARGIGFEPPNDVWELPAVSCLHTVVTCDHSFIYHPDIAFVRPLAYTRARGLELCGDPLARVLLVETDPAIPFRAYIDLWIPIR